MQARVSRSRDSGRHFEIAVHNQAAGFRAGSAGIHLRQEAVVPSVGRLGFLARNHIFRIGCHGVRDLRRAHEARVEADPGQLFLSRGQPKGAHCVVQPVRQLRQRQPVHAEQLIPAEALQRSAAVIPEDQGIPFRRIMLPGVAHQKAQRPLPAHVPQGAVPDRPLPAGPDLQNAAFLRAVSHLPPGGSPGHDQEAHLLRGEGSLHHFPDIRRGGSVLAFQVAAAHVDHQRQLSGRPAVRRGRRAESCRRQNHQEKKDLAFHASSFFMLSEAGWDFSRPPSFFPEPPSGAASDRGSSVTGRSLTMSADSGQTKVERS